MQDLLSVKVRKLKDQNKKARQNAWLIYLRAFTLTNLRAFFWWRRRESNPRPKALTPSVYMLILPINFRPEIAGKKGLSRSNLS